MRLFVTLLLMLLGAAVGGAGVILWEHQRGPIHIAELGADDPIGSRVLAGPERYPYVYVATGASADLNVSSLFFDTERGGYVVRHLAYFGRGGPGGSGRLSGCLAGPDPCLSSHIFLPFIISDAAPGTRRYRVDVGTSLNRRTEVLELEVVKKRTSLPWSLPGDCFDYETVLLKGSEEWGKKQLITHCPWGIMRIADGAHTWMLASEFGLLANPNP